jgi:hypothetical protein
MTSRERVVTTLQHREPDRIPIDFGATTVSGLHVTCVAALRDYYGLEKRPVKVHECLQMLGLPDEDLKTALGVDVEITLPRLTSFGFPVRDWKPWRLYNGLEVLVPGDFNTTLDANGDTLIYPQGDTTAPASGRMPNGGHFFDVIVRQEPINEDRLNPEDNLEEYGPIDQDALHYLALATRNARASGRAVVANFGGTGLGDIARVPGPQLKHPKGIRDVAEWYMSTTSRRDYIKEVFSKQCDIALGNLHRIYSVVGGNIDVLYVCGTDFGTQLSTFCSLSTFRDLYLPFYKRINDWVHQHTPWKTFKHSCGSVVRFIDTFIEAGFDILNPVQCSAAGMDPEHLKSTYGERVVFWGGGIDTQQVLPFGTPAQVREQVLRRCEIFARGGGFVFNAIHNVQAETPVENIVAMFDAVHEFNGQRSLVCV